MSGRRTQYVLDTNIFIQAKNDYYAFDICPGFWDALNHYGKRGSAISIDRVLKELEQGHDELSDWAVGIGDAFFRPTAESKVIDEYGKLVTWAQSQSQFTKPAKAEFSHADNADAWVVAYAKANNCTVATHEAFEPNSRKKVKIPNACRAVGVTWVNTFEMLRTLETKLVLAIKRPPA